MFLCNCYINKCDKSILNDLKNLGYKISDSFKSPVIQDRVICFNGTAYGIDYPSGALQQSVNCEDNERLFFALAALNEDNYYHQWLIDRNGHWFYNRDRYVEMHLNYRQPGRKATKEEIILRFR